MKEKFKKLKLKKPSLKNPIKQIKDFKNRRTEVTSSAVVPLITNETIAEHREEVLSGARKYIYPLQHSKHRIVLISSAIFIVTLLSLFTYGVVALYKLQTTSTFVYSITQVVPFPVAKKKGNYISYESYLFELRHYMHYYETQQKLSFKTQEGQQQLADYKRRALDRVVNDAYVKELAKKNNISVSNQEVDAEIDIVRQLNRLGTTNQVFEDVLRDFWGWSLNDFKRSLRQQILTRKVVSKMDTEAHAKANSALAELSSGMTFADAAKKYSGDPATKDSGGDYGALIDKSNRDIPASTTQAIFGLKPGAFSQVIDTGYSLEIVKLTAFEGGKARASHIQINFKDISEYLNPIKEKEKARLYIKV